MDIFNFYTIKKLIFLYRYNKKSNLGSVAKDLRFAIHRLKR